MKWQEKIKIYGLIRLKANELKAAEPEMGNAFKDIRKEIEDIAEEFLFDIIFVGNQAAYNKYAPKLKAQYDDVGV